MKFIVDECIGPRVAAWMSEQGYDVVSIFDSYRGIKDHEILQLACNQNRVIVTADKDFGDLVFRLKKNHKGVVLLRLEDERNQNKINVLKQILENHQAKQIVNNYIVATELFVRVIQLHKED